MNRLFFATILAFVAWGSNPIDYGTLSGSVTVTNVRAGNHDESGLNEYFFTLELFATAISKENRNTEMKDRKNRTRHLGEFGAVSVKPLTNWTSEDNSGRIRIEGEIIRELVSESMRFFETTEDKIAISARITMFEKNKQFFFFGEDTKVGEVNYFVIPETIPHQPLIETQKLQIKDDLGTLVSISVEYDNTASSNAQAASQ
ncbi:MAG: hypothetical protein HRU19_18990 [Pseudobacteriovorax sp.]|nr:hypothetical protein [Pseudobacteriovorax sp.]